MCFMPWNASSMFSSTKGMPMAATSSRESSMSGCTPFGMSTPTTRSAPSASAQRAAVTLESLPPETPTTAEQVGPFSAK